jgi:hypothetical protein
VACCDGAGSRDSGRKKKRLRVLTEYLLGGNHQPAAVTIGIICEAFNCTPQEAKECDIREVREILDYRRLKSILAQHNEDASKISEEDTAFWMECNEALTEG